MSVRIARSTIKGAGLGAFATRDYERFEYLGSYKGEFLTPKEYSRLKDAAYVWELLDDENDPIGYIDARDPKKSNWLRYVNCPCSKKQENVKVVQNGFKIEYYAKRRIRKGDELFVWYGPEYSKILIGRSEL